MDVIAVTTSTGTTKCQILSVMICVLQTTRVLVVVTAN